MDSNIVGMASELEKILKQIDGVTGVDESVCLAYVVVTKDETSKNNVNKVVTALTEQAQKFKLDLDITVATQSEVEKAKNKLEQLNAKKRKKAS